MRGRVVSVLREYEELTLSQLGPRIRVDYGGEYGEEWLQGLLSDLEDDGLVSVEATAEGTVASLRR
jgi:A/G-specific adenine glycosylase